MADLVPMSYDLAGLLPDYENGRTLAMKLDRDNQPMRFCIADKHSQGKFSITLTEARSLTPVESLVVLYRFLHTPQRYRHGNCRASNCPGNSAIAVVVDLCTIAAKQTPYAYLVAAHFLAQRGQSERDILHYLKKFDEGEQRIEGVELDVQQGATQSIAGNMSAQPSAVSPIMTRLLTPSEVDHQFGLVPLRDFINGKSDIVDKLQQSFVELKTWAIANQARLALGHSICLEPRKPVAMLSDGQLQKDAESHDAKIAVPALIELASRANNVASAFTFMMRARITNMGLEQVVSASSSSSSMAEDLVLGRNPRTRQLMAAFARNIAMVENAANPQGKPPEDDTTRLPPILEKSIFEAHIFPLRQYISTKLASNAEPDYIRKFLFCYGTLYALTQYLHLHWPKKQDRNGSNQPSWWQRWVDQPNQINRQKDFLELLLLLREPRDPESFGQYIEESGKSQHFSATSYGIASGSEEYQNARRFLIAAMKQCGAKIFYEALAQFYEVMEVRANERSTVEHVLRRDYPELWSMAFPVKNAASNQLS